MTATNFYGTASQAETSSFLSGSGDLTGTLSGSITGSVTGSMTGSLVGFVSGTMIGVATGSFTGSFSGEYSGSGANLYDISASSIIGLNLSRISTGSVTASVDLVDGFVVNTKGLYSGSLYVSGTVSASQFSGSGADLYDISASAILGLNLALIGTGSVSASTDLNRGFTVTSVASGSAFSGSVNVSGSTTLSGSLDVSSSAYITRDLHVSGTIFGTSSFSVSSSYLSGSSAVVQNLEVVGTASIKYLDVVYQTASYIISTGSNRFGDETVDQHQFTGSVNISGSFGLVGSASFSGGISSSFTGSLTGSFIGEGDGIFTGSFTGSFLGEFEGTASQALTASYAANAASMDGGLY
jgi:hypothetical protein